MKTYEIINPSDPYTFHAPDFPTALAVVLLLGEGAYAADPGDDSERGGIMLGWKEKQAEDYLARHFGDPGQWCDAHAAELADAFDSVMSFKRNERTAFDEAVKLIPEEERAAYRARVHDSNRSSMNDIGARAWKFAEGFRAQVAAKGIS